jgi:hypothetical protein
MAASVRLETMAVPGARRPKIRLVHDEFSLPAAIAASVADITAHLEASTLDDSALVAFIESLRC